VQLHAPARVRLVLGLDGLQQRWGYGGTASGVDARFRPKTAIGSDALRLVIPALDGRKAQSDAFFGIDGVLVGLPSESLKGRLQLTVFRGLVKDRRSPQSGTAPSPASRAFFSLALSAPCWGSLHRSAGCGRI